MYSVPYVSCCDTHVGSRERLLRVKAPNVIHLSRCLFKRVMDSADGLSSNYTEEFMNTRMYNYDNDNVASFTTQGAFKS